MARLAVLMEVAKGDQKVIEEGAGLLCSGEQFRRSQSPWTAYSDR